MYNLREQPLWHSSLNPISDNQMLGNALAENTIYYLSGTSGISLSAKALQDYSNETKHAIVFGRLIVLMT